MNNAFINTIVVWKALFLRESLDRFFGNRAGWAWLIIEPSIHIAFMCWVWSMLRHNTMGGIDMVVWIIIGMISFFLFRRTAVQTLHARDCNKAFFMFRQVRPFDVAISRATVEAFSMFFISLVIILITLLIGRKIIPEDPLSLLFALLALWLLGLGYGLITSIGMRLIQDLGHIFQIIMMPLYLVSGVILPVTSVPYPYRNWLLYNPLVHGIELARLGFFTNYNTLDVSFFYLYSWVFILISIGMGLYKLLETRMVMQ